ncbi:Poly(A) polymerase [Alternaria alternata]|nr:Poly(A) polymerase [Alternaria alternata]
MTFSRRERLDRRRLAKTRRRRTRKVLSATSPIQALTCVTPTSSNPLDARPRQRAILRYHANHCADIGQRAFSSKASTVRACYQWSAYSNGSISSLSAKLAHFCLHYRRCGSLATCLPDHAGPHRLETPPELRLDAASAGQVVFVHAMESQSPRGAINLLYTTRGKKDIRGRESGFCN